MKPRPETGRLEAHVTGRRGSMAFDLAVSLEPGEIVAVLGPNGAGKSTLLECLAGLLTPSGGYIRLDGRVLFEGREAVPDLGHPSDAVAAGARDAHSGSRVSKEAAAGNAAHGVGPAAPGGAGARRPVPPARRGIGLLGQDPRLFPHLSARDNVAFGLAHGRRAERMPRARARTEADAWLARVGLASLGDRRPRQLSGGQQQRVAVARALAAGPAVLLLDEPLVSLDVEVGPEIRRLLRDQLRATGTSAVLVSHDVLDAVALADRIVVVDRGRVVEEGPTASTLLAPRTSFLAALAGVNLVIGVAAGGRVIAGSQSFSGIIAGGRPRSVSEQTDDGSAAPAQSPASSTATAGAASPDVAHGVDQSKGAPTLPDGIRAAAVFRPSSVIVATARPEGTSLRNIWRDRIASIEPAPGGARLRFEHPPVTADVTAAALAELDLRPGGDVWLAVKASEVGLDAID
jgi:molybdate transport system ATP-binding protein